MSAFALDDPRPALGALWNGYVVLLHATVFLAGVGLALPFARRAGPAARAHVHAVALVGMLVVTALCWLPIGWWARLIPGVAAGPLLHIGARLVASAPAVATASDVRGAWLLAGLLHVWIAGGLLVVARLAVGWWTMRRIAARAMPVTDRAWNATLRDACAAVGATAAIDLRRSAEIGAPLTSGVLAPVILIPDGADAWTPEERRMVLLHEAAHVRRADCLLQLLARVALAWYWFHPGAWLAMRGLRAAREDASDRMVLDAGVRRSDYAECLLRMGALARGEGAAMGLVASVAMARPRGLHRRIRRVLSTQAKPRPARWDRSVLGALAIAAALAWTLILGTIRLAPQRSVLWTALEARDWSTRAYAAFVLSHSRFPAVRATLRSRAASDPHPMVRDIARGAP